MILAFIIGINELFIVIFMQFNQYFYFLMSYSIIPQLEKRFNNAFNSSSVELISKRNVHFVSINSMAMEMDGCFLCYTAKLKLKQISSRLFSIKSKNILKECYYLTLTFVLDQLKCSEKRIACSKKMMINGNYSKPVLLQVIINNFK